MKAKYPGPRRPRHAADLGGGIATLEARELPAADAVLSEQVDTIEGEWFDKPPC